MESNKLLFDDIEYVGHRIRFSESQNCPVVGSTPFLTKEELSAVTKDDLKNNKDLQKMHHYGWHKSSDFYKNVMDKWNFPNERTLMLVEEIKIVDKLFATEGALTNDQTNVDNTPQDSIEIELMSQDLIDSIISNMLLGKFKKKLCNVTKYS